MPPRRPSRFSWTLALVWAAAGLAAQACLWWLPHDYNYAARTVLSISVGVLAGCAFFQLWRLIADERIWQSTRHLPKSIHIERQTNGEVVAFVEALDGTPRIVTLPWDYDPQEDQGRLLLELLVEPEH